MQKRLDGMGSGDVQPTVGAKVESKTESKDANEAVQLELRLKWKRTSLRLSSRVGPGVQREQISFLRR